MHLHAKYSATRGYCFGRRTGRNWRSGVKLGARLPSWLACYAYVGLVSSRCRSHDDEPTSPEMTTAARR